MTFPNITRLVSRTEVIANVRTFLGFLDGSRMGRRRFLGTNSSSQLFAAPIREAGCETGTDLRRALLSPRCGCKPTRALHPFGRRDYKPRVDTNQRGGKSRN